MNRRPAYRPAGRLVRLTQHASVAPNGSSSWPSCCVIFGGSQLPKLARNLGKAQKEFKDGLAEGQADTPTSPTSGTAESRRAEDRDPHRVLTSRRVSRPAEATVSRDASVATSARRRLRMRRRSRSLHPPHTPWSMRCSRAYSRHGVGHRAAVADLAGLVDAHAVAREERRRRVEPAVAVGHPRRGRVLRDAACAAPSVPSPSLLSPCRTGGTRADVDVDAWSTSADAQRFPLRVRGGQDPCCRHATVTFAEPAGQVRSSGNPAHRTAGPTLAIVAAEIGSPPPR